MTTTLPVLEGDLDPLAHELLVMAVAHRDILHVEYDQRRTAHLSDS